MSSRLLRTGAIARAGAGGGAIQRPEVLTYGAATPPTPLDGATTNVSAGKVGVRFQVTEAIRVWSVRGYFPNTGYAISEMYIEGGGTVLATTGPLAGVNTVSASWVERDLQSYVELEPGVEYRMGAVMGETYQHYHTANSPFNAHFTMVGGFRWNTTYAIGMGLVDIGYELV